MMLFLLTSPVLGDSLNLETAKLIINSQHDMAMYGITVVVGLFALLLILYWLLQIPLANRKIDNAIKNEITGKASEEFKKYTQELDKKLEDNSKKMDEKMEALDDYMFLLHSAETSRLHANNAELRKLWDTAALWWSRAVKSYAETHIQEKLLRVAVNGLMGNLQKCEKLNEKGKEEIKECLPDIPDILSTEKRSIEKKLDKLPNEAPKKS